MPPASELQQLFCDSFFFANVFQFPVNFLCRVYGMILYTLSTTSPYLFAFWHFGVGPRQLFDLLIDASKKMLFFCLR